MYGMYWFIGCRSPQAQYSWDDRAGLRWIVIERLQGNWVRVGPQALLTEDDWDEFHNKHE